MCLVSWNVFMLCLTVNITLVLNEFTAYAKKIWFRKSAAQKNHTHDILDRGLVMVQFLLEFQEKFLAEYLCWSGVVFVSRLLVVPSFCAAVLYAFVFDVTQHPHVRRHMFSRYVTNTN